MNDAKEREYLSPHNLHIRLRVIEIVLAISLLLSLLHWYIAGTNDQKIQNQVDNISQQTGVAQ
jgi:hypothetical protein